jgi:tRNA(Ile)-lysidine synthase
MVTRIGRPARAGGQESGAAVLKAVEGALAGDQPLIARGATILVACSGGADSTALLAALADLARRNPDRKLRVSAGHVDHGLRPTSAGDAAHVRELAAHLDVTCHIVRLGDLRRAVQRDGLEAAARQARYAALTKLAAEAGAGVVATAHTRRDQAETLLLRLSRGAGPGALAGVRPRRTLAPGIEVVRPLLEVPRGATEALCAQLGLRPVDDAHNHDTARARTRVRLAMGQLSELLNPRLEESLAAAAALLNEEDEMVTAMAAEALQRARAEKGGLRTGGLAALHPALQRRVLVMAALDAGGRPERRHVESLRLLVARPRAAGPASLHFPGAQAHVRRGLLTFAPLPARRPHGRPPSEVAEVAPSS